jgi:hypothetical protein
VPDRVVGLAPGAWSRLRSPPMASAKRRAVRTLSSALVLIEREGALTLSPGLVEAVAGEPVKGTWWAHPQGKLIFQLGEQLEDHEDVLVTKWIAGKVTFVHRRMWPALVRIVTDEAWRAPRKKALSAAGRALFTKVEKAGTLRLDKPDKAKKELEASLLVRSASMHTEKGKHATVLGAWSAWATPQLVKRAAALSLEEALSLLPSES